MIHWLHDWWRNRHGGPIVIDDTQWEAAESPLACLDRLGADERQRLRELATAFIAAKEWSAASGLQLTPAIQLSIALQACLPILNLGLEWYDGWVGIIVYPGDFVIPRQIVDETGVVHEFDDHVLGEAWEGGPVLLSWFADPDEIGAISLIIHEFAHKLDMRNGVVDGMPPLHADMSVNEWIAAFAPAYADHCQRVDAGEETAIDAYAEEHPAEFFAVASEVFFEAPDLLRAEYPEVYAQLCRFYRQTPL
ncbi:zinc-dependent peptidase [Rhodocyclaceae bacterium]